jgi:hypothetical protein
MEYPRYHKEIVNDLMAGKFILASDPKFVSLKEQVPFYEKFFKESFGYEMEVKSDFAYLLSYETAEQLSRMARTFWKRYSMPNLSMRSWILILTTVRMPS